MTMPNRGTANPRALPQRPNLEYLKNEAKRRLDDARSTTPGLKLADVQFQLAREYGFASWRDLKARIEQGLAPGRPDPVGDWVAAFPSGLKVALHIRRADTGHLRATLDVPSQGYFDDPIESVTAHDERLSFVITVRGVNVLYDAAWDEGGGGWSGVWIQTGIETPLAFVRGALPPLPAAEGLDGLWDGFLTSTEPVRLTFRVFTDERGTHASLESSRDDGVWRPAVSITRERDEVVIQMQTLSVRGRLSADGREIAGEWTRDMTVLPLTLTRRPPGTGAPRVSTPTEIAVPVEALTDYAGIYGLQGSRIRIAVEDGRLWSMGIGGGRGLELVPFAADAFFTRHTDTTVTFERSDNGKVAAMVMKYLNGRELRVARTD